MERTLVVVTLLVAAALAVVIFMGSGDGGVPARRPGDGRTVLRAEEPLAGVAPEPAEGVRLEGRAVAPAGRTVEPTAPPAPEEGTLWVTVRSSDTGAPVPDVRVHLLDGAPRWRTRNVEGSEGRLGESPTTDAEGRARFRVAPGRAHEVQVWAGSTGSGSLEVLPFDGPETREAVVEVSTRADVLMVGRVVSDETGRPLADARVQLVVRPPNRSFDPDGNERERPGGTAVEVDSSGRFEVPVGSWSNRQLEVRAPGHGTALVSLERGYETDATALEVRLARAATVVAHVSGVGGEPIEGAHVLLETDLQRLRTSWGSMSLGFGRLGWSGRTGPDGRTVLLDVPPRLPFAVTSTVPGAKHPRLSPPITLEPGERRELFLRVGAGANLAGSVVDTSGASTGGVAVWLRPGEHETPRTFQEHQADQVRVATVDAGGRFAFEDVADGLWWLGLAPGGPYASAQVVVRVDGGVVDGELRLEVTGGLEVAGMVLGPQGEPLVGAHVVASGAGGFASGPTDGEGRFAVGPVSAGAVSLWAGGGPGLARSQPVEALAGDRDVVLRLAAGGGLQGVLLDGISGEPRRGKLMVARSGGSGGFFGSGTLTSTQDDGTFSIDRLEPGSYDLSAVTTDGKVAVRADCVVTAGDPGGALTLRAEPGAVVLISYPGPQGHASCRLLADGALVAVVSMERGVETPVTVPAGAIRVEVRGPEEAALDAHELLLGTGERRALVLGQAE